MKSINERGGIIIRMAVAIATLAVIGGAIFTVLQKYQENQKIYHRKALSIGEYGMMMALEKLGQSVGWRDGFNKVNYEDGWYHVSLKEYKNNDTLFLAVSSEGHLNSVCEAVKCLLSLDIKGNDSSWTRRSMQ